MNKQPGDYLSCCPLCGRELGNGEEEFCDDCLDAFENRGESARRGAKPLDHPRRVKTGKQIVALRRSRERSGA